MKKLVIIITMLIVFLVNVFAQKKHQLALGYANSLVPKQKMISGNVGLLLTKDKSIFIDYNIGIKKSKNNLKLGLQTKVIIISASSELNKNLSYYNAQPLKPLYISTDGVEIYPYIKKTFILSNLSKSKICLSSQFGPNVLIGYEGNFTSVLKNRTDNSQSFLAIINQTKGIKNFVIYARATIGIDYLFTTTNKLNIGLSPFFSLGILNSDKQNFTTVPNDPTYKSIGSYKKNRNEYGIKMIFNF